MSQPGPRSQPENPPYAPTLSLAAEAVDTSRAEQPSPTDGANASQPPKTIGRFAVQAVLGQGAFGAVYRALDPQLDRHVAIKVPRPGVLKTAEDMHRFLREARAAATLNHPQVCSVFEVGEEAGRPYIVMALIEGKTLADVLRNSPPPSDRQAATAIRKVALALEEAHRKQIIHRDLKPGNIMINRRGEPVVMDFGLARLTEPGDVQLTVSGVIMGTPAYMSPEQARGDGRVLGPSTDIFSLGVILYEMLAGRRPFDGTLTEVLASILHVEPPSPRSFRPTIDPRLEAICLKALAKKPEDRYPTMTAFAAALGEFLRDANKPADAPTMPPMLPPSLPPVSSYLPTVAMAAAPTHPPTELPPALPIAAQPPTVVAGASSTVVLPAVAAASRTVNRAGRRSKPPVLLWCALGACILLGGLLVLNFSSESGEKTPQPIPAPANNRTNPEAGKPAAASPPMPFAGSKPIVSEPTKPAPASNAANTSDGWIELFNGKDLSGWQSANGGPATWRVVDGAMEIDGPSIMTERKFGPDYELHVEFWIAKSSGQGQRRGNSGIYLQGRHEIQIMDGYQNPDKPEVSCGALYGVLGPSQNVCRPPEQWQSFDITFRAPRSQAGGLSNGRVSVVHNGVTVIDDREFPPKPSSLAVDANVGQPGPIMLQNHGNRLRFRNLRLRELAGNVGQPSSTAAAPSGPNVRSFAGHRYQFVAEQLTWKQARLRCEEMGGYLFVPDSIEENQFVGGLIAAAGWQDAWMGITDEAIEGDWRDIKGRPIALKNWFANQPNNKNQNEHFGLMTDRLQAANWRWCDQPNTVLPPHRPGYVCEWDR